MSLTVPMLYFFEEKDVPILPASLMKAVTNILIDII